MASGLKVNALLPRFLIEIDVGIEFVILNHKK